MTPLKTLEGPVELIDGALSLRIPRALAGPDMVTLLSKACRVDDASVTIRIPDSVAASLELTAGSMVAVDNRGGAFAMRRAHVVPSDWQITSRRYAPLFAVGSWALFAARDDQ